MKFCFHNTFPPNLKHTNNCRIMTDQVYIEIGEDKDYSNNTQTGHMYFQPSVANMQEKVVPFTLHSPLFLHTSYPQGVPTFEPPTFEPPLAPNSVNCNS